jgi:hypothetical protein
VPLSFQPAFSGFREIHWLPGFCMIYRRQAVGTQRFDEVLPAYGTEDGIFSMAIGRRWRLLMWGDLHVRHHADPTSRCTPAEAIYGGSFSLSRNHWLETGGAGKPLRLARYALCEFVLDLAIFLRRPNRTRVVSIAAKQLGLVKGAMSAIFNARHYPDVPEMSR